MSPEQSGPGSPERPLRVAVIGSGPAGFYTVQHLLADGATTVSVDMFDRLPTPFGLVRHGVAPDHQKIKSVTAVYHKLALREEFRFFGGVEYGKHLHREELARFYDQVVFCTGAETDRRLGIPGEDLPGSHPATAFVAWYNGHPDFADHRFELDREAAVVVGVGNVAVDVARVLCRTPEELARTDIADHALAALRESRVRRVYLLGRRGPAQAAFTNPEVKELGELTDTWTSALEEEVELDAVSRSAVEAAADKATRRKLDILAGFVGRERALQSRALTLRFLVSPVEILGDAGGVTGVRIVRNRLVAGDGGRIRAEAGDRFEELDAGLVFRSVGYHGIPLPELPFREDWGIVPNEAGRITDGVAGAALPGLYVAGWIKRGPSGVIGTNKPDALETVKSMREDLAAGRVQPGERNTALDELDGILAGRGARPVSYDDWMRLDAIETARGAEQGRPRVKLVRRTEIDAALSGGEAR